MQAAGCELHEDLTQFAFMWFLQVLLNIRHFWRLYQQARGYFAEHRPAAVVLIDYPGFNWWIARAAKQQQIPVFYYGAPQIWAWARWRIKKMRRLVDHVLCKLPFEADWYREQGCLATYVGHPFFDETTGHRYDAEFLAEQRRRPGRLVAILPGSRKQEVRNNLPWFIRAAKLIHQRCPDTRFAIASFNDHQARMARELIAQETFPMEVSVGHTPELMHLAECCLACSGSVSLELLYHEKPTVILYWMHRWMYLLARALVRVRYVTLVNLLADGELRLGRCVPFDPRQPGAERVPFPEYATWRDKSPQLASHIIEWLTDEPERQRRIALLRDLKVRVAQPGASQKAADYLVNTLTARNPSPIPAPHFPQQTPVQAASDVRSVA